MKQPVIKLKWKPIKIIGVFIYNNNSNHSVYKSTKDLKTVNKAN